MTEEIDVSAVLSTGVYVLCRSGRVVWVGRAVNLVAKLYAHMTKKHGKGLPALAMFQTFIFDTCQVYKCRVDQLDETFHRVCIEVGWAQPGATVSILKGAEEAVSTLRRRA